MKVKATVCFTIDVDIDDKFQDLDRPFDADISDIPEDEFDKCIIACSDAVSEAGVLKNSEFYICCVESLKTGNVMAEQ